MAFTPEQEAFLARLADAGLAELADAERRNQENELAYRKAMARQTLEAQLNAQKDAEIAAALAALDAQ